MVKLLLKILAVILIAAILLVIYMTFIERNLLVSHSENLEVTENSQRTMRIVQFSDTHLGEFYSLEQLEDAVEKINAENPDIVVFTGDLFDNAAQFDDKSSVSEVLGRIRATYGKFAIFGNRDYGGGGVRSYESVMQEGGFTVLVGEKAFLEVGGRRVALYGSDDYLLGNPDVGTLMSDSSESDLNVLLVHEPDAVDDFASYPFDIALSGHSHGGQVVIPFFGAIQKTAMCDQYFKGTYQLNNDRGTQLYVSSGLGNTKVPFRLGNIPEIVVLEVGF